MGVVFADVIADGFFQGGDAAEGSAPDAFSGDFGKPALDLIEPGGPGGREVPMKAWMVGELLLNRGMLVGAVVIQDEMNGPAARRGLVEFV